MRHSMFLSALSARAAVVALTRERTGWWIVYGISLAAILLTHYTGVFVVAAQVLWALWMRPRRRREILLACVAGALVFALWIPSVKGEQIELYGEVAHLGHQLRRRGPHLAHGSPPNRAGLMPSQACRR